MNTAYTWLTVLVVVTGIGCCVAGVVSFRLAKTTVDPVHPDRASTLVVVGIYHLTRNPMYLGFVLIQAAWAVYFPSLGACGAVWVLAMYLNRVQIPLEEAALQTRFGESYQRYMQSVPRWL
ncbi:protein-S-isoprenylcysteine O-methyltransferase Ste14 [Chitinivorax tropicus]|uniref:Protein-S-isoprenylcysteine O-methyltransferase Ste14 n=1 Tax=Chitinivorax tropicus TaxID=714531 RepID=A0A840MLS9_9PROT|nr:isoprenylcysteine carboxylmethyltransferase family protein [Chitinivorax tropicus]MBB5017153.1 protein-S-isoprenylcysteine O-methyltransferase Ste14 [Chitinivorax tropicus]